MNSVRTALYGLLSTDPALSNLLPPGGIYHRRAPRDAAMPFVIFTRQAGTPRWTFQGEHIETEVWLVKAVVEGGSASTAEDIAARIDKLLTDAQLDPDGERLMYLRRESTVDYGEDAEADTYHHVGGLYRLVLQPD